MFTGSKRFELLGRLGEGGMGVVYNAYDRVRELRVALKILNRIDATNLYRFKREFRVLRELSHPNIVTPYELIADGDEWLLAMEPVVGQDFMTHVRAGRTPAADLYRSGTSGSSSGFDRTDVTTVTRQVSVTTETHEASDEPQQGPRQMLVERHSVADVVDVERLRACLAQLAQALYALHRAQLIHRDLKPSNVIVTEEGKLVLIDFGIVLGTRQREARKSSSSVVGTPAFMAPEQLSGGVLTPAVDWYAFGVMLYWALAGRRPYEGGTLKVMQAKQAWDPLPLDNFIDDAPEDLAALCLQLLERRPEDRPGGETVLERLGESVNSGLVVLDGGLVSDDGFVGRARELSYLEEAFRRASDDTCRFVVIEGLSGMGKSFLLDRFVERLRSERVPFNVLRGRCHARESMAYKAFDGVVDELSQLLVSMTAEERRAVLPDDATSIARLFPTLSRVAECDPGNRYQDRNPLELRKQAFSALRTLLYAVARERVLILRLEDLQWADADSLALLQFLLDSEAPAKLLICGTLRPKEEECGACEAPARSVDQMEAEGRCSRLLLGPLAEVEQRQLIGQLAPDGEIRRIADSLWRDVAGHPMLLVELLHYLRDTWSDGERRWHMSVEDMIWKRVCRLPAAARVLVELIAVAGEPTEVTVLAHACGLSGAERERGLSALALGRFTRTSSSAEGGLFIDAYHDKLRRSITENLAPYHQRELNRRLAIALEDWGDETPASLAERWLAAGEPERAVPHLVAAARSAAQQTAIERSNQLYRRALEAIPAEVADEPGYRRLRCQAWLGLADGMRIVEDSSKATGYLQMALELAAAASLHDELAAAHILQGNLLFPTGRWQACLEQHQQARQHARRASSLAREAQALGGVGDACCAGGRMTSAFNHLQQCVELCRENGFVGTEIANLPQLAWSRYHQLELPQALADAQRAIRMALEVGHTRAEFVARSWASMLLTEMGANEQALEYAQIALDIARTRGWKGLWLSAVPRLAHAQAALGRRQQAEALLLESLSGDGRGARIYTGPLRFGALARVTDDAATRKGALEEGEHWLSMGALPCNHLDFCRDAMNASLVAGEPDRIEHYADVLRAFTADEPTPWSRYFVARGRALAGYLRDPGDPERRASLEQLYQQARECELQLAADQLQQWTALGAVEVSDATGERGVPGHLANP